MKRETSRSLSSPVKTDTLRKTDVEDRKHRSGVCVMCVFLSCLDWKMAHNSSGMNDTPRFSVQGDGGWRSGGGAGGRGGLGEGGFC